MIQGFKGVKYGLTVPASKKKAAPVAKPGILAAFGDDDSDGEHEAVPQQLARQAASKKSNNKVAELHAAALAEDASVFDYDGVYDSMQEAKAAPLAAARQARGSKYIEGLLDKAGERKREQDIIFERMQVKERQAEDHLFGDKEKFVTAAYKKKLQQQQLWQAQQKIKDERDAANAAEKVGDMSGFYGNLMTRNVAFGASGAKKAADVEARRDEAAAAAADTALPPSGGSPAAATAASPAAERDGGGSEAARPSVAAAGGPQSTEAQRADSGDPGGHGARESSGQTAAAAAAPGGPGAGETGEAGKAEAAPAAPKPTAVKHTDATAKEAARERYLARKNKRKAAGEPDA